MNPLNKPWGEAPASAPSVKAGQSERPANSVPDEAMRGLELEIAQGRDRMWRAERRKELLAKLDRAHTQKLVGVQLVEWAGPVLGLGVLATFIGYRFEHSTFPVIGSIGWGVGILALIAAVTLFTAGWVIRFIAWGQVNAVQEYARRQAIDIEKYDSSL